MFRTIATIAAAATVALNVAPAQAQMRLTMDQLIDACQQAGLNADRCGDYAADRIAQGRLVITDHPNGDGRRSAPQAPANGGFSEADGVAGMLQGMGLLQPGQGLGDAHAQSVCAERFPFNAAAYRDCVNQTAGFWNNIFH